MADNPDENVVNPEPPLTVEDQPREAASQLVEALAAASAVDDPETVYAKALDEQAERRKHRALIYKVGLVAATGVVTLVTVAVVKGRYWTDNQK